MSSGFPSMFKSPKPRSFDYKPLIYDPQKERKAELEKLAEEQLTGGISDERRLERLRSSFRLKTSTDSGVYRRKQSSNQQLRLVLIMTALVGLVALFFNWA